jgi:aminoglycoside phosphotransferase (APT) family kinase protein
MTLFELKRTGEAGAIAQAAFVAGQVLARIHSIVFQDSGWIGPGPQVTGPLLEGKNPVGRFVDRCLASPYLQRQMDPDLRVRFRDLISCLDSRFADLCRQRSLVHGDFGKRNILLRHAARRWSVAAVLDWEFAISGPPLADLGHFLRYEHPARPVLESEFVKGYLDAGGRLPDGWRRLARLLDAISLCESLTSDLPPDVSAEVVELVRAVVEDRDPQS